MTRVGEDVSERLDIVPAEFFVHRHIYGKWTCRCCQRQGIERLVQEPADPQIIDGGIAASGLVAHTLISRFVDHLPYYRQETINARSGVHTPRSTLARTAGNAGAAMVPLYEAHKRFVLSCPVLHADETPVAMLDPGAGKTKRAYIWAYARGELDAQRGVIYEFCLGRGSQYPVAFLGAAQGPPGSSLATSRPAWRGTLVCDQYAGYDAVLDKRVYPQRIAAHCVAHARRKFDELAGHQRGGQGGDQAHRLDLPRRRPVRRDGRAAAPGGAGAADAAAVEGAARLAEARARPRAGRRLDRRRDRLQPEQLGRTDAAPRTTGRCRSTTTSSNARSSRGQWDASAWLFCGSELAGQRAAIVMSLVQSAKLNGHDPWAYLRDVLERLPSHPNSRIEELLPHRWQPAHA